jgi:hypothetical protein
MTSPPDSDTTKRRLGNFKVGCTYGGFGRTKAYELIEAGKIDAYKMGHQTMIDLNSVDRYHASLPKIGPGGDAGLITRFCVLLSSAPRCRRRPWCRSGRPNAASSSRVA